MSVVASWIRPSDRSGPYVYRISYEGLQNGPYSGNILAPRIDLNFNDTQDNNTVFMFTGLASAEYNITVTAVNIKTSRQSPSVSATNTTVAIGIIY